MRTRRGRALATYREALEHELPTPIRNLVERQYEGSQRNHRDVRAMRESLRAAART
ncbi:MAG TPA: hypothetical protein VFK10_11280 [Burkholderiaceae bacterium]|nr:hypothetical protein [Burkholderiaceae bacterium]